MEPIDVTRASDAELQHEVIRLRTQVRALEHALRHVGSDYLNPTTIEAARVEHEKHLAALARFLAS